MTQAWTGRATRGLGRASATVKAAWSALRRQAASVALVLAIVAGPLAVAALVLGAEVFWRTLVHASDTLTAALHSVSPTVRDNPGQTAEAIRIALGAALAALAPSLAIVAFERGWREKAFGSLTLYPCWMLDMLAPAAVLQQFSPAIDPSRLASHLSADFLVLFSAAATSIALGFSLRAQRPQTGFAKG